MRNKTSRKRFKSIKNKLIGYACAIILLMMALSIYALGVMNLYKGKIDSMFVRNVMLQEITSQMNGTHQELQVYLSTKNSGSLNKYMFFSDGLEKKIVDLEKTITDYSEEDLFVLNMKNMVINYVREADLAIEDKRRSDIDGYMEHYKQAQVLREYIFSLINELNVRQLSTNSTHYLFIAEKVQRTNTLNILLLFNLMILSIIIVLRMAEQMITPIVRLSASAEEIAQGDFETEIVVTETGDEIEVLSRAFNHMKENIQQYIETVQEKAHTEAKLKDQMVENLKMQSLLDNARLYALQSQMNPHFLFNTINAGVQMAMIEGADRTSEFLESMSRLFRYNIQKMEQVVTLEEEVQNVKDYVQMLKVRFGDLIIVDIYEDLSANDYRIPPLTLQPIVENAYIHGLSHLEEGGHIQIHIENDREVCRCIIEDDGCGISLNIQEKILNKENLNNEKSAGVGMKNVIERLELFYKKKGLLTIESSLGCGTKICVYIPHIEEEL